MRNFAVLSKKDVEDLKAFKASFIAIIIRSIFVIGVLIVSYLFKTGYKGFTEYTILRSTAIDVLLVSVGFTYRERMISYINNYKNMRSILDKTKVKSGK